MEGTYSDLGHDHYDTILLVFRGRAVWELIWGCQRCVMGMRCSGLGLR